MKPYKSARIEKQFTQRSLDERLFITPHYLMSIENGKQIPSCGLLFRIVRALEIPADLIFYPGCDKGHGTIDKLKPYLYRCDEKDVKVIMNILQYWVSDKTVSPDTVDIVSSADVLADINDIDLAPKQIGEATSDISIHVVRLLR